MDEVAPAVRQLEGEGRSARFHTPAGPHVLRDRNRARISSFLPKTMRYCRCRGWVGWQVRFDERLRSTRIGHNFSRIRPYSATRQHLEAIAFQKAGIIKRPNPGCQWSHTGWTARDQRKVAADLGAPLYELDRDYNFEYLLDSSEPKVTVFTERSTYHGLSLNLLGAHQAHKCRNGGLSLRTTSGCWFLDSPTVLSPEDWAVSIGQPESRSFPGTPRRFSIQRTMFRARRHWSTLLGDFSPVPARKVVVFGVSSDKQYADIIRILSGYFDHFHLTKYGNNPRSVAPDRLAVVLGEVAPGKPFTIHSTAREAWLAAQAAARPEVLVCVTGSMFLAGELRSAMTDTKAEGSERVWVSIRGANRGPTYNGKNFSVCCLSFTQACTSSRSSDPSRKFVFRKSPGRHRFSSEATLYEASSLNSLSLGS